MGNKTFAIDFDATVVMNGTVYIQAENKKDALILANLTIFKNLNPEECNIELDQKGDSITIREMELIKTRHSNGISITDIMAMN